MIASHRHIEDDNAADGILARLVLARVTKDDDAYDFVDDEIGRCGRCWNIVAALAVCKLSTFLEGVCGHDNAVALAEEVIAEVLDNASDRPAS